MTCRLALAGVLLVLSGIPSVHAAAQSNPVHDRTRAADSLIGIWVSELNLRAASPGELVIERGARGWRASLAGVQSRLDLKGDSVFVTAGRLGRFRGVLNDSARTISGYWLQPIAVTPERRNAVGYRQPFATKLVLRSSAGGVWRGIVHQVPERFTLYLSIYRDTAGELVGAFRNHDFNSIGGASLYPVSQEGDSVFFTLRPEGIPEIRHAGVLRRSPDRLQVFWRDVGVVLDLKRRPAHQVPNFFPCPPGQRRYAYRQPPVTGDGWATARARDVGMDESVVARAIQAIIDTNPAIRGAPLIHSILVARRGKLVLEEYFYGFNRDTPHDLRSAGKTFSLVMLGGAMLNGTQISPQSKVYDVLAEMGPFANPDPRKSEITLAHLMTHSAGFACDDYNDDSPGNEDKLQAHPGDWWKYTLDLPMAHPPGTRYAYCSANINLVGAALTVATRTWLPELFERTVAGPLQFGRWHWNLSPTDEGYLGGGSWLRPRDLLKIGQTYLNGGVWNGRRIVSAAWVAESTAPHMHISPATTGMSQEDFSNGYSEGDNGYAWHLGPSDYSASGNGGQVLIVAPEHDLVIVFTGANYRQGWIWGRWGSAIGGQIISAIAARTLFAMKSQRQGSARPHDCRRLARVASSPP